MSTSVKFQQYNMIFAKSGELTKIALFTDNQKLSISDTVLLYLLHEKWECSTSCISGVSRVQIGGIREILKLMELV